MKTAKQFYLYKHPWALVIEAYFRRYPTHPRLPVLLSTKVLSDTTDAETGVRHIQRECVVDVEAPMWLKRALRQYDFMFLQKTWVDLRRKVMRIVNANVTYAGTIVLGDECEYKADPENPEWTIFEQQAQMQLPNFPFSSVCEQYMVRSYERNTSSGRNIDGAFIDDVVREGWYERRAAEAAAAATPAPSAPDQPQPRQSEPPERPQTRRLNRKTSKQAALLRQPREGPADACAKPAGAWSRSNALALVLFAVGLALLVALPQVVIAALGSSAGAPGTWSLLSTLLSVAWVMLHFRLFPQAWRELVLDTAAMPVPQQREQQQATLGAAQDSNTAHEARARAGEAEEQEDERDENDDDDEDDEYDDDDNDDDDFNLFNDSPAPAVQVDLTLASASASVAPLGARSESAGALLQRRPMISDDNGRAVREEEVGLLFRIDDCATVTVPAWVERVCMGKLQEVYIVQVQLKSGESWSVEKMSSDFARLQKQLPDSLPKINLTRLKGKKGHSDSSYSTSVEDRRCLLEAYLQGLVCDDALVRHPKCSQVITFLRRRSEAVTRVTLMGGLPRAGESGRARAGESFVRRDVLTKARWRHCWSDVLVVLEADRIDFFCQHVKIPHCVVMLETVRAVELVTPNPLASKVVVAVRADERTVYVMGEDEAHLREWMQDVDATRQQRLAIVPASPAPTLIAFQAKHSTRGEEPIILNNACLSWDTFDAAAACALSMRLLADALRLCQVVKSTASFSDMSQGVRDGCVQLVRDTCKLQGCEVAQMSHEQRVAFWTNVYHTLSVHAYLCVSEPGSLLKRRTYNNSICYDVQGRLYSLMEIEHCVLRAPMSKPHVPLSSFVIPRFSRKDTARLAAALGRAEPRLNFVLNCGTYSSPYYCFVLDAEHLDRDLTHAAEHFLKDEVHVLYARRSVTLPRVCQWYADDLGTTTQEMLRYVVKFMPLEQGRDLVRLLELPTSVKVAYSDYDWGFRGWVPLDDGHTSTCMFLRAAAVS